MKQNLNIAHYLSSSKANGPGERFTIWLQGCPFDCKGCFNSEYRIHKKSRLITPEALFAIIEKEKSSKAVTFSGGEPFFQAPALSELAGLLKKQDYTILSYTGYTLHELQNSSEPAKRELLSLVDILIDGPYKEELQTDRPFIGSSNQNIHYLTEPPSGDTNPGDAEILEFTISEDGIISLSGFPDKKLINTTRTFFDD